MTLLKLVPLGDCPTITFTAAAPVQPGPSHPEDDPAYAGPSRRRSYDSPLGSFRHSSRQGSHTPPRKRRRLLDDSSADEGETSSHRQHRNDQQDDEELFRHASLALLLDYIMRMFPAASNTWSSLLPNDFTSSRLPV